MTFKEFEKKYKTKIVNYNKDHSVLLTSRFEDLSFVTGGGLWRNVEVYTVYKHKSFLGIGYWKTYSNIDSKKVFKKFEKWSNNY